MSPHPPQNTSLTSPSAFRWEFRALAQGPGVSPPFLALLLLFLPHRMSICQMANSSRLFVNIASFVRVASTYRPCTESCLPSALCYLHLVNTSAYPPCRVAVMGSCVSLPGLVGSLSIMSDKTSKKLWKKRGFIDLPEMSRRPWLHPASPRMLSVPCLSPFRG